MSDVERIAQTEIQMLAYEMHRAIEGIPYTAPECFVDFTRSAGAAITELLEQIRIKDAEINSRAVDQLRLADERDTARAALARRDAAIQAVQDLHYEYVDSFDATKPAGPHCYECCESFPCNTLAAIAAEMEKP